MEGKEETKRWRKIEREKKKKNSTESQKEGGKEDRTKTIKKWRERGQEEEKV